MRIEVRTSSPNSPIQAVAKESSVAGTICSCVGAGGSVREMVELSEELVVASVGNMQINSTALAGASIVSAAAESSRISEQQ